LHVFKKSWNKHTSSGENIWSLSFSNTQIFTGAFFAFSVLHFFNHFLPVGFTFFYDGMPGDFNNLYLTIG
jgi:hypothetical protein